MKCPEIPCRDDRLRDLLRADEDSGEYQLIARHVEECTHCQLRLEELAASSALWQEAHSILLDESGDPIVRSAADSPGRRSYWSRRPAAWTESMARQLLAPPAHPEMLGRIGRYDVERLIGSGGMGIVFKAFDTELNRPVAVKVLAPYLACSSAARKRFAREARAAAAVVHEHVVAIHNVESSSDSPFLVMPFVAGESLQQRIDRQGPLDLCEILRIAMQTAAGLAAAHAQGLVHRDVKPSNILLEQGVERALLTDFGLAYASDDASLTRTGYHPGTPQYMSPEQARGETVDVRSDLFSLGSVMYAMCTGQPPFRAETSYGILRRITDDEPRSIRDVNPAIPDWLERIIHRLLSKSPAARFRSAQEVSDLLEKCLAHVQHPTAVELPAVCQRKASSVLRGRISLPLLQAIRFRGETSARRAVAVAAVAIVALFVVIGLRDRDGSRATSPDANKTDHRTTELPAPALDHDPSNDWEAVSAEIETFSHDLAPFETRSRKSWDDDPSEKE